MTLQKVMDEKFGIKISDEVQEEVDRALGVERESLPTTADKRAAACAEAFNIIRTLFSHGVLFSIEVKSDRIEFHFIGSVHALTAKRLIPNIRLNGVEDFAWIDLTWN